MYDDHSIDPGRGVCSTTASGDNFTKEKPPKSCSRLGYLGLYSFAKAVKQGMRLECSFEFHRFTLAISERERWNIDDTGTCYDYAARAKLWPRQRGLDLDRLY
jgi:hypothetical protein